MVLRNMEGPAQEWLTEREFADYLGLRLNTFRDFRDAGIVPEPVTWNKTSYVWSWRVVVWFSLGLELGLIDLKKHPDVSPDT